MIPMRFEVGTDEFCGEYSRGRQAEDWCKRHGPGSVMFDRLARYGTPDRWEWNGGVFQVTRIKPAKGVRA